MANDYYEEQFTGQAHGRARVANITASLRRIMGGFDKLPTETQLKTLSMASGVATGGPVNFVVTLPVSPFLTAYVDHMRIGVRWNVANDGAANLDVVGQNGARLGSKPIRQLDGSALSPSFWAADSSAILQYAAVGAGHWTILSSVRGQQGPPGPPDGTFSVNVENELIFSDLNGVVVANLGRIAFRDRGAYAAGTTYEFLDVVQSGGINYWHHSTADTTGVGVANTGTWRAFVGANDASTTVKGVIEIATDAETIAASSGTLAVPPSGLAAKFRDLTQAAYTALVTKVATVFYFTEQALYKGATLVAEKNPAQAAAGEKTAGTETDIRSFSPADIVEMIGEHGGGMDKLVYVADAGLAITMDAAGTEVTVEDLSGYHLLKFFGREQSGTVETLQATDWVLISPIGSTHGARSTVPFIATFGADVTGNNTLGVWKTSDTTLRIQAGTNIVDALYGIVARKLDT